MQADSVRIPKFLDEPERFLIFTKLDLVGLLGPFVLGMLTKMPFLGLGVAVVTFTIVRQGQKRGWFDRYLYVVYWFLPSAFLKTIGFPLKGHPPSYYRELTG